MGILDSKCDMCGLRDGGSVVNGETVNTVLCVYGEGFRCKSCLRIPAQPEQDGPGCDEYETMEAQKWLHG